MRRIGQSGGNVKSGRGYAIEFAGGVEVAVCEWAGAVDVGGVGGEGLPLDRGGEVGGGLQDVVAAGLACELEVQV